MRKTAVCFAITAAMAAPAYAQLGPLGKIRDRAVQAKKLADMQISDKDERAIGLQVSAKLVETFGVYQDAALTKYVTLVGTVLAQASARPDLDWRFIVLDTDGVNAYAAPGGLVHITRGALAMVKSEGELAGVLAHELTHVTARHTIRAIQKARRVDMVTDEIASHGGLASSLVDQFGDLGYDILFENKFDRSDELEADKVGLRLANSVGYSPAGLSEFLTRLAARNSTRQEPNGLFASHPVLKERLQRNDRTITVEKLTATAMVQARYARSVTVQAKPMASIAVRTAGARGVAADGGSDEGRKPDAAAKTGSATTPRKKRGFGLGALGDTLTKGRQAESSQASASAGGRMIGPDNHATGGSNRTLVVVNVTPAELGEFRKGIA